VSGKENTKHNHVNSDAKRRTGLNTGMRRTRIFRSTADRIYDGGPMTF